MHTLINEQRPSLRSLKPNVMSLPKTFLQRAEEIVLHHLSDDTFGVKKLSEALHLCPSQTYRKIKARTGGSPSAFILHIRLGIAHDLLLQTDFFVTQIAYQVGFSEITYFSHCFKEHYGKTATQVRHDAR
ncbi:MAG: helix-turn-helix transcriptional regulator [Saprospiraceae bacterium]